MTMSSSQLSSLEQLLTAAFENQRRDIESCVDSKLAAFGQHLESKFSAVVEHLDAKIDHLDAKFTERIDTLDHAVQELSQSVQQTNDRVDRLILSTSTIENRLLASRDNFDRKQRNAASIRLNPQAQLLPLLDLQSGREIAEFPVNLRGFANLDFSTCRRILQALQFRQSSGDVLALREMIRLEAM